MSLSDQAFWRRTPPALFPATLGMFGMALAWRNADRVLGVPGWAADLWLGAATAVFTFVFACYLAKIAARPSAILGDLSPVPGRAAVSAGSMCLMMLAAGLVLIWDRPALALPVWLAGIGLHVLYMCCVITVLIRLPKADRCLSPTLFLPFVGYIVAPIAGVPLGFGTVMAGLYVYTLLAGAIVLVLCTPQFFLAPTPVPSRPAAAILLAPTSVAAISAHTLGWMLPVPWFLVASLAVTAILVLRIGWLTAGGWTPLWGAFTFPSAAFAGAMLIAAELWAGPWTLIAWTALIAASFIVAPIWVLTLNAWAMGRLAPATGARIA